MRGGPLTPAWLDLFQAHLSVKKPAFLRWSDDLAESAEMRRAYSAMYGRYFSRGILASRFGFTDFASLERGDTVMENGVIVSPTKKGDKPDWIAWDAATGSYVLAEAKGNLTGDDVNFLFAKPSCIGAGKAQFGRVSVKDSQGQQIKTRNWVAANLWSTDDRERWPVSLLWDPDGPGEELAREDVPLHAAAIRGHRIMKIAAGLGRSETLRSGKDISGLVVRISIDPSGAPDLPEFGRDDSVKRAVGESANLIHSPIEEPARKQHEDIYIASMITPLGIRPILDASDLQAVRRVQLLATEEGGSAMVYGLSVSAIQNAQYERPLWLSNEGIVSTDGAGLFDLKKIEIEEM